MPGVVAYATVETADAYFAARAYHSNWSALTEPESKRQYLNLAGRILRTFTSFTPEGAEGPVNLDDPEVIAKHGLAGTLEAACLEEALHLLNLGKDPTQTLKVLNLGILSTDGTAFDHRFVADILCPFAVQILTAAGFEIASLALSGSCRTGIIRK